MKQDTTSQEFFESKYKTDPDPWNFESSEYEQSRYDATIDALEERRYSRAFEPGCSIGILTARLAPICDQIEACDISPTAVKQARERCKHLPNANVFSGALPHAIPSGDFDLIALSEIGYYFDEKQLRELGVALVNRLVKPGTLLAVHWLGRSNDHVMTGEQVHRILGTLEGLAPVYSRSPSGADSRPGFRLDRWDRV